MSNNMQSGVKHGVKHYTRLVFALFMTFFLCSSLVDAAVISGSIYDLALQKESNVIVEINTMPKQLMVSKGGEYAFNVKPGNYTLYAHTSVSESTESLVVDDDGNYTLDIILGESFIDVPSFKLPESDINLSLENPKEKTNSINVFVIIFGMILIILLCITGVYLFMYTKKAKSSKHEFTEKHKSGNVVEKPLDEYEHKVMGIIKKEKRTTQKDLRKEIPLSEAKISLIISDLESKGKIRKIKKGRGNILIFVKD